MKKTAPSPLSAKDEDHLLISLPKGITLQQFNRVILPSAVAVFSLVCVALFLAFGLRVLFVLAFIVLCVFCSGFLYQTVATFFDRHRFPPPGQLVEIDGTRLHIHAAGTSSPTVVFESGLGAMSAGWGWIQTEIQKFTRTVSYDRAGLG